MNNPTTNHTLHLSVINGETEQQKRRRAAIAITQVLCDDSLLCDEVAALLDIPSDTLVHRTAPTQTIPLFTAL
tara:strand:+ start:20478 stop:20696 length:219 start_codon:yes stop_codon:yes gene_type:complete